MNNDYSVQNSIKGHLLSKMRSGVSEEQVQKMHRQKAFEDKPDCYYHLIDYRNNNEVLKKSVMTSKSAREKNAVLRGTGMAWARLK